jgi:hypothetical protein
MIVAAQENSTELVPFEDNMFGVQGLLPDGWQSAGAGVYARNASAGDITRLIIQSAPLPRVALLNALRGQLSIEELPEPERQIESDFAIWDIYRVDLAVQDYELTLSIAVTDADAVTYIVILQSLQDEHDAVNNAIFAAVIESLAPIVDEAIAVPYIEEDVTFESGDITLAGTLTLPSTDGIFPAVILISGSGASNRDESLVPVAEIKPFRDIADYLTRNGIAVLRYDERGVGESTGDIASATLQDFRDDANAALDYLANRDEIDSTRLGIIGHSEGGAIAPEIALMNENVAFVIGLGAPAVSMFDIIAEQNRIFFANSGASEEQIEQIVISFDEIRAALLEGDDELLRNAVAKLIEGQTGEVQSEELVAHGVGQFTSPIMRSYAEYDSSIFWTELEIPILSIYGGLDTQVSAEQNMPALEELTRNNPDVTIVKIAEMNHILQKAETGQFDEYVTLEQTVMPEMLNAMTSWILERFAE